MYRSEVSIGGAIGVKQTITTSVLLHRLLLNYTLRWKRLNSLATQAATWEKERLSTSCLVKWPNQSVERLFLGCDMYVLEIGFHCYDAHANAYD
jgi:hypothetical protein